MDPFRLASRSHGNHLADENVSGPYAQPQICTSYSGGPTVIRRTLSTLAVLALTAGLSACSDDKKDPEPKATDSTTSAEPTPTKPAWEDKYTEKQLKAYEATLQRWESYLSRSEPIWAEGKATPQAEDLFDEYFSYPGSLNQFTRLKTYDQVDVKTDGQAEVFWSKAAFISKDALSLTVEQCVNYSASKTTQRGNPIEPKKWATEPRLRTIKFTQSKSGGWLIDGVSDETTKPRPERCTP